MEVAIASQLVRVELGMTVAELKALIKLLGSTTANNWIESAAATRKTAEALTCSDGLYDQLFGKARELGLI